MKFLKWAGKRLVRACIYFTVTQFFITAMFQTMAKDGSRGQFLLFDIEVVLFGFSLIMALAQDIFGINRLSFPIRLLIHFLVTMAALFGLFSIITGQLTNVTRLIYLLSGAAVIYAVGAAVVLTVRAVKNKRTSDDKEYTPMFKKEK
jgi:hypothetical protein